MPPRLPNEEGGEVEQQVQETFAEDFAESEGQEEVDENQPTEGELSDLDVKDPGLPDFEKFLRDSEPKGKQAKDKQGDQQQQRTQEQQPTRPDRYEQDQRGNIIDPRTGQVLARAGAEARLYMDSRRAKMEAFQFARERDQMRGHLQEAVNFIDQYRNQLAGMREANSRAERLGITPTETAQAIEFVARLKRGGQDGLQAIKEILTRAAAAGMDVQSLGVGTGGIDVKAIVDQIRQEFAPIRSGFENASASHQAKQQADRQQAERYSAAAQITYDFFSQNEEALPFAPVIEKALRDPRYQGWTIREVWQQIQLHLANRGSTNGQSSHREIPRGGRQPVGGVVGQEPIAHPDQSFADLVNAVLDEHGIQ